MLKCTLLLRVLTLKRVPPLRLVTCTLSAASVAYLQPYKRVTLKHAAHSAVTPEPHLETALVNNGGFESRQDVELLGSAGACEGRCAFVAVRKHISLNHQPRLGHRAQEATLQQLPWQIHASGTGQLGMLHSHRQNRPRSRQQRCSRFHSGCKQCTAGLCSHRLLQMQGVRKERDV